MHEYHMVEEIIKQILNKAKDNGALKITKVTLVINQLSGIEESSVRLYFQSIAKETKLEGAQLLINKASGKLKCNTCDMVFDYNIGEFNCPNCGKLASKVNPSAGIYIDSIEIEN